MLAAERAIYKLCGAFPRRCLFFINILTHVDSNDFTFLITRHRRGFGLWLMRNLYDVLHCKSCDFASQIPDFLALHALRPKIKRTLSATTSSVRHGMHLQFHQQNWHFSFWFGFWSVKPLHFNLLSTSHPDDQSLFRCVFLCTQMPFGSTILELLGLLSKD